MFRLLAPVLLTVTLALANPFPAQAETRNLVHAGETRSYIVEFPAAHGPAPAVIVLHGGGGTGRQVRRATGFTLTERGFVEIYPDALNREWNDGRVTLADAPMRASDDVGFLRALVASLAAEGRVDPSRVFVTGISNGGAMTQRLLCDAPDLVAGAAVVAMNLPAGLACPPGPPAPLLFLLGTADPIVPYAGGPITIGRRDRGAVLPAEETYAFYASRNRCGGYRETLLPDSARRDGVRVRVREWQGCAAPFAAYIAEGGGHSWPGARHRPLVAAITGRTAQDISATAEISAFFEALARR